MDSFNPIIICPHCGFKNKPSITGWGGEGLNARYHNCKRCNLDYIVVIFTEASTYNYKISAMHINTILA